MGWLAGRAASCAAPCAKALEHAASGLVRKLPPVDQDDGMLKILIYARGVTGCACALGVPTWTMRQACKVCKLQAWWSATPPAG